MPYLGNTPTANFASVTKDTFNGDGSETAFTLSKTATTNGVAVYVENVRQIPTTAYAVSGTTLTFTGAPPSGTNNIYVMHHNTPVSTATHPSAQDLTAANATLTGDVTIGSGTAADRKIVFDGNAQDYHVGLDDSADSLIIGKGSALGTTSHIVTDENGHVTMPLQSAFLAEFTTENSNISINTNVHLYFDVERFDINADYASNTFTAPVTGTYAFFSQTRFDYIDIDAAYYYYNLVTSNRTVLLDIIDPDGLDSDPIFWTLQGSTLVDMDAGDTAKIHVTQSGGSAQTDAVTGNFSGYLVA